MFAIYQPDPEKDRIRYYPELVVVKCNPLNNEDNVNEAKSLKEKNNFMTNVPKFYFED